MPHLENLSAEELEQIKRFIEETDVDELSDEMRSRRDALALAPEEAAATRDPLRKGAGRGRRPAR